MTVPPVPARALDAAVAVGAAVQLVAARVLVSAGDGVAWPGGAAVGGMCPSRAVLHLACPFCGLTRSFVALAHGEVARAFRYHAAGPLLFVTMSALVAGVAFVALRRAPPLLARPAVLRLLDVVALVCVATGLFQMTRS